MIGDTMRPEDGAAPEPRRTHMAWRHLAWHHRQFIERMLHLGETWHGLAPRDELEAAIAVTWIMQELDGFVGDWLCAVWWALLQMSDVEREPGSAPGEWELAPDVSPMYRTALAALQPLGVGGTRRTWDGDDPSVRRRLDVLRATLHALSAGYQIVDPLADVGREAPLCRWGPPTP